MPWPPRAVAANPAGHLSCAMRQLVTWMGPQYAPRQKDYSNMKPEKGRILVVDDDREIRTLLEDFFIAEGHEVATLPSAVDALKALGTDGSADFDVIFTDLKM